MITIPLSRTRPIASIKPVAILAACLLSGGAYAANFTWIGSGDWNTAGNWDPAGFTSGNTPVFSGSAAGLTTNNDLTSAQIDGILFDADAAAYTLTGNTGTLTGNIVNNSANLQTISLGLILNNTRTITTNGDGGDITINGVIGDAGGNRTLVKTGEGTLTLTAANTYGQTQHAEGALRLDFAATGAPVSNILSGTSAFRFGANGVSSTTGHSVVSIVGEDGTANSQSFSSIAPNGGAYGTLNVVAGSGGSVAVNVGQLASGSNGGTVNIVSGINTTIMGTTAPGAAGIYISRYLWNGSDWMTGAEDSPGVYTLGAYAGYVTDFTGGTNSNVSINGSASSGAGTVTVNTLKLATTGIGQSLTIGGGNILRLQGSGLLSVIDEDYSITGGILRGANNGTDLYIHQNGSGILTIGSNIDASAANWLTKTGTGTLVLTGNNAYGNNTSGGGTYVTGGILSVNNNARLGNAANAPTIILNSGTLQATATFALDNGSGVSRNIRLFAGGGGIDVTDANTLTVSGTISDGGDLTKTGSGTLALTNVNTNTGSVYVNAGTLLVTGTGSLSASSSVFVNTGGTLGGDGTINGTVTVRSGGFLTPGSSPGTLNVGSFDLESGGTIVFDLAGDASYDALAAAGNVTLAGNLSINLTYMPAPDTSFTIIVNNGSQAVIGVFAGLAEGAVFTQGGQQFEITYLGGTGNDVVITAVPEPAAALLAVGGVAMLLWRVRRRVR